MSNTENVLPTPAPRAPYEPPRIERLGTLAELTLGGGDAISDGTGGTGDIGSA